MKVSMQEIVQALTSKEGVTATKKFLETLEDTLIPLDGYDSHLHLVHIQNGVVSVAIRNQTTDHYALIGEMKVSPDQFNKDRIGVERFHFTELVLEMVSRLLFREVLKDYINPKHGRISEMRKIMVSCAREVTQVPFDDINDKETQERIMGVWRYRFMQGDLSANHFISIYRLNRG